MGRDQAPPPDHPDRPAERELGRAPKEGVVRQGAGRSCCGHMLLGKGGANEPLLREVIAAHPSPPSPPSCPPISAFPPPPRFSQDKPLHIVSDGDVLIDDRVKAKEQWEAKGGKFVLHGRLWPEVGRKGAASPMRGGLQNAMHRAPRTVHRAPRTRCPAHCPLCEAHTIHKPCLTRTPSTTTPSLTTHCSGYGSDAA